MDNEETLIERDYVYKGERIGKNNLRIVALGIIEDGAIVREFCLKWDRNWKIKAVGCVYTGAKFGSTKVVGAAQAKYKEQWADKDKRLEWSASHHAALDELEDAKLEKKLSASDEIGSALMPLRRVYWKLPIAQREAMERAVLRSLRKLP